MVFIHVIVHVYYFSKLLRLLRCIFNIMLGFIKYNIFIVDMFLFVTCVISILTFLLWIYVLFVICRISFSFEFFYFFFLI